MTHTNNPTEQQADLRERLAYTIWPVHGENPRDAILNNVIDVFIEELTKELESLPRSGFVNSDGIRLDVVSVATINGRIAQLKET